MYIVLHRAKNGRKWQVIPDAFQTKNAAALWAGMVKVAYPDNKVIIRFVDVED